MEYGGIRLRRPSSRTQPTTSTFITHIMLHFKLLSALAFVCLPAAADTVNELAVTHVDSTLSDVTRTPRKVGQFFQQANPSIKFGGYIMTKYSISDRSGQKSNGGFFPRD